jgi:multidrug efflux pump subunit AcrA (membrane-fusion protein)
MTMPPHNGHPNHPRGKLVEPNIPRPAPRPRPTRAQAPARRAREAAPVWPWLLLFFLILAGVGALVLLRRSHAEAALKSTTAKMATPTVLVVKPEKGAPEVHLVLPGTVDAYIQSTVYAQVTGYLKRWLVDIGTPVKQGQLLAEIETPARPRCRPRRASTWRR